MKTRIEQFTNKNPNPVLSVAKDGTVLYSNEASEPLLHHWGVAVGKKLPSSIGEIVQRVIRWNSPENMEVKVGNIVYVVAFHPLPKEECVSIYGFDINDQKKLEEKFRESERRLSEAQRMAHIGNWDWDIATDKAYWSDELYHIFGRNPQELAPSYSEYLHCVHPDDKDYADNVHKKALSGNAFSIDHRIILDNGEIRTVHIQTEVIFDDENVPIRLKGTVQDITERKRAEENIQTLANIVESSHDGIGAISLDGIITSWNKGAEQIYGYSAEDILGKNVSILEQDIHKGEIKQLIERIRRGEAVKNYETARLKKDGRLIHVSVTFSPVFDTVGRPSGISVVTRDITERKKAETEIQNLANIVESSNDAIITRSVDGIITSWNKAAEQIHGYSAKEMLGKHISILEPDNLKGEIKQFSEKIKQGEKVQPYETLRLKKDGTIINVSVTLSPVFDASGELVAISAIVREITQRKRAEEALAKAECARKKEIHHRIKNNLQVISSLLDLQADKFNDKKVVEAFRESQNRVISMALIHEELYKGEDNDTLNFSEYLQELIKNLFCTYKLDSQNIHLWMDLEENTFFNMDIAVPLGIIVNELVSNSLKHAFSDRENGEIRIKLHKDETGECKTECCKSASFTLTVSDNGVGIPENNDIENLDSLGLQLVTSLVDQLDGELEIKRDNGTAFTVRFTMTEKKVRHQYKLHN